MKNIFQLNINTLTIRDVRIRNGKMERVELSNGKSLGGITSGIMRVSPHGQVMLMLEIEATPTINGQDARLVLDASRILSPDGTPTTPGGATQAPPVVEAIHAIATQDGDGKIATVCGKGADGEWGLKRVTCADCLAKSAGDAR